VSIYTSTVIYLLFLVLWCLTPLSTIFQLFRDGGNRSPQRKSPDLPQASDKLYHKMLYRDHLCVSIYTSTVIYLLFLLFFLIPHVIQYILNFVVIDFVYRV
jgi:hypothetical protein